MIETRHLVPAIWNTFLSFGDGVVVSAFALNISWANMMSTTQKTHSRQIETRTYLTL